MAISFFSHWALVLSIRVAFLREAVGAASRREVLGISEELIFITPHSSLLTPNSLITVVSTR
ncbi:MAG: hypothetical protein V7K85_31530 [Nostoc sp.]